MSGRKRDLAVLDAAGELADAVRQDPALAFAETIVAVRRVVEASRDRMRAGLENALKRTAPPKAQAKRNRRAASPTGKGGDKS